jgi:hypothetical protein
VVEIPYLLEHSAIVSTTDVGDTSGPSLKCTLEISELVGSRDGRHDASANTECTSN